MTSNKNKIYKIMVDGEYVGTIELEPKQYDSKIGQLKFIREYAERHSISAFGIKLSETLESHIYLTDMDTGKTHRKYV